MKTYAWITITPISRPISATKIANGISVTTAIRILLVKSVNMKPARIVSSIWPARTLARQFVTLRNYVFQHKLDYYLYKKYDTIFVW